jgi:hypothetical protein
VGFGVGVVYLTINRGGKPLLMMAKACLSPGQGTGVGLLGSNAADVSCECCSAGSILRSWG